MKTEITSKSELESLIMKLDHETAKLYEECNGLRSKITNVNNHDGINVYDAGNELGTKMSTSMNDLDGIVNSLKKYINGINELDIDDFTDGTEENVFSYHPTVIAPTRQLFINSRAPRGSVEEVVISSPDLIFNPNIGKYSDNKELGFEVTTHNLKYDLCEEDEDLLCAVVASESDKSYDDSLALASTVLNRCEKGTWIESYGRDPIAQLTATDQYKTYQLGTYEQYLNGKSPETVKTAVKDALSGIRNHSYCEFSSNSSINYSNNLITATGNRYK